MSSSLQSLLSRPPEQRLREYKYRCAQSIIFGLPVLALQWFGHSLGGPPREADRWIAILQALLSGWVVYVAATGMAVEGLLRRRVSIDFVVAAAAIALYLYSLIFAFVFYPTLFHVVVILLATWCGWRWWRMSREPV